jgi:endonuclease/exonuclease/phosphatase family metal-dependent hydrolase
LALVSDANIAGKTIATYNIHLESRGDDPLRFAQLEEVLEDSKRHTSNTVVLLTGDFNMDVSQGPAAGAITRVQFQDAFANHHEPTTPGSFLEHGRIIDWIFTRGRVRSIEPLVHRSVSASDHYPLSIELAIV